MACLQKKHRTNNKKINKYNNSAEKGEKQNPEQTLICNARLANFGFTILTNKNVPQVTA